MKKLLPLSCLVALLFWACDQGKVPAAESTDPEDKSKYIAIADQIEKNMVQVEAGSFLYGCTAVDSLCSRLEDSLHTETVKSFRIGKYEVTNEEWAAVMGPIEAERSICKKCPAEEMTWYQVMEFIGKLNATSGKKFRLPTGVEWEYAARGGHKQAKEPLLYAGSNVLDSVGWHVFNSGGHAHEVGLKKPNELGLYDMTGNVEEWSTDTWKYNKTGADKLRRGGGWSGSDIYQRVFVPRWSDAQYRVEGCGFRLVLD